MWVGVKSVFAKLGVGGGVTKMQSRNGRTGHRDLILTNNVIIQKMCSGGRQVGTAADFFLVVCGVVCALVLRCRDS